MTENINTDVFPATARRGNSCGEFKIQEIKASALAETYGTPLYVVDEVELRARARAAREAFENAANKIGSSASVYYASKALLNVEVAKWVHEEGLNVDVASGGELAVALAAGVDPHKIGLHGNNKSAEEITAAVSAGVGTIILDSEQEIERVATIASELGKRQKVRLRVNSGVHASTHDYLATSHEDQKFGLPLKDAVRLIDEIRGHKSLEFLGLHCHIGSQIYATEGFAESARRLLKVYAEVNTPENLAEHGPIPELNLGGGYGIAYLEEDVAEAPNIETLANDIAQTVKESAAELGLEVPRLAFEPGRYIAGPAGVTLYTVGTTKSVELAEPEQGYNNRLYVSVDGGMSDNMRPALYGADYDVKLANRRSVAKQQLVRVVGKHCESGDIVINRGTLPADVRPGDLLVVPATGAYCWSLSNNYNYLPRPAVVAVNAGKSRVIVRGQTQEELLGFSVSEAEETDHTV